MIRYVKCSGREAVHQGSPHRCLDSTQLLENLKVTDRQASRKRKFLAECRRGVRKMAWWWVVGGGWWEWGIEKDSLNMMEKAKLCAKKRKNKEHGINIGFECLLG